MIESSELLLQRGYAHLRERPDAIYMVQPLGGGRVDRYSWTRTFDEAKRLANYLVGLGLPERSQIAMISKNCASFIIADLAIWMAGHVSVAIFPTVDADTVSYVLEHSESKLILVGKLDGYDGLASGIPEDMARIAMPLAPESAKAHPQATAWSAIQADTSPIEGEPVRDADDLAIIVYTSGSTGQPKGVMHNFRAMSISARGVGRVVDLQPSERMLSYLPLAHVLERWLVECTSLFYGFEVYFAESLNTFVQDLQRARPTMFVSVPRLWLKFQLGVLQKLPQSKLSFLLKIPIVNGLIRKKVLTGLGLQDVRYAASGSAPIPPDVIQWYRDLGLELFEGYGMSENFAYSHACQPGRARVGYVGEPYPEVESKLSPEGEILVKSPGSMMGYFKADDLTAEAFTSDGFLRTGDRGEVDELGRYKITGRVKELFKTSKGKYVAPAPIENLLNNDAHVELSCVFGSGRPMACAVVNLAEGLLGRQNEPGFQDEITEKLKALLDHVNATVLGYEKLQFIAVAKEPWTIENQRLTPTMKIKRANIEDTFEPRLDEWFAAKAPVVWE